MTSRRPIRRTGKWRFQAWRPVLLVDDSDLEVADRPQPERLEVAERLGPRAGDRRARRGGSRAGR